MSVLLANPDYLMEGFAEKRCKVWIGTVCHSVCGDRSAIEHREMYSGWLVAMVLFL